MQRVFILLLIAVPLLAVLFYVTGQGPQPVDEPVEAVSVPVPEKPVPPSMDLLPEDTLPSKAVLDITVHTIDELRVLFDRAESLAMAPQLPGVDTSVVLVLHGPEVEFFSINNYEKFKDIVDQAERLDALDVVDVRICQMMMEVKGIPRDDIPAFVDQVPQGPAEVDRLVNEGYVYF